MQMNINNQFRIYPVKALKDNYIWVIVNTLQMSAMIVDPGEAAPVINFITSNNLSLIAILATHHHWDHINGIGELIQYFDVPVYAPTIEKIPHMTALAAPESELCIPGIPLNIQVLGIPGHTKGHVAYYAPGMLFCGDTLFAAGCGRIFEGTPEQMFASLQKLAALPDDTNIYCGHEYTFDNLRFAEIVEPGNPKIHERKTRVSELRNKSLPSLPSTLLEEKETNPFLRCDSPELIANVEKFAYQYLRDPVSVFTWLRKWKDNFQ